MPLLAFPLVSMQRAARVKWVISKSAICVVFVLFTSVEFASAQTSVSNVNSQTSDSVADSSVGLRTQLETILKSAGKGDQKDFADRIAQLRFPDAANWFSTTFGNRTGKRLVEAYESSYKDYEETVSRIFIESSKRRHTHVFVSEFSQSAPEANAQFMQAILADAQVPVRLYTAFCRQRSTDRRASGSLCICGRNLSHRQLRDLLWSAECSTDTRALRPRFCPGTPGLLGEASSSGRSSQETQFRGSGLTHDYRSRRQCGTGAGPKWSARAGRGRNRCRSPVALSSYIFEWRPGRGRCHG